MVQCIGFSSLPHVECREATLKHQKKRERSCREPVFALSFLGNCRNTADFVMSAIPKETQMDCLFPADFTLI